MILYVYRSNPDYARLSGWLTNRGLFDGGIAEVSDIEFVELVKELMPLSDLARRQLQTVVDSNKAIIAKYSQSYPACRWDEVGWAMNVWQEDTSCGTIGCAIGNSIDKLEANNPTKIPHMGRFDTMRLCQMMDLPNNIFDSLFFRSSYDLGFVCPVDVNNRIERLLQC